MRSGALSPSPRRSGPLRRARRVLGVLSLGGARFQGLLERRFPWFVAIVVGAVIANEVVLFGSDPRVWDWMLISGTITLLCGLALARSFRPTFDQTINRLRHSGTIRESEPLRLAGWFSDRLDSWSHSWGLIIAATMGLAFLGAYGPSAILHYRWVAVFTVLSMAAGYIVGRYVGQALLFARLHSACRQVGVELLLQPGHLDGAAGWRPVGQLYFRQALLLALPAAHLGLWWFLIPAFDQYRDWRTPYVGLLAFVLLWEGAAFIVPMWAFHKEMSEKKRGLLMEADEVGHEVAQLKAKLAAEKDAAERKLLKERLDILTDRYETLERLPTWPLDAPTRRRFSVNNAVLALPLLAAWLDKGVITWSEVGKSLGSWLG